MLMRYADAHDSTCDQDGYLEVVAVMRLRLRMPLAEMKGRCYNPDNDKTFYA